MNARDLIEAIGNIDYDMVIESEKEFGKSSLSKKNTYGWAFLSNLLMKGRKKMKKILVCTLCIVLCVGLAAVISRLDACHGIRREQVELPVPSNYKLGHTSLYNTAFNGRNQSVRNITCHDPMPKQKTPFHSSTPFELF